MHQSVNALMQTENVSTITSGIGTKFLWMSAPRVVIFGFKLISCILTLFVRLMWNLEHMLHNYKTSCTLFGHFHCRHVTCWCKHLAQSAAPVQSHKVVSMTIDQKFGCIVVQFWRLPQTWQAPQGPATPRWRGSSQRCWAAPWAHRWCCVWRIC